MKDIKTFLIAFTTVFVALTACTNSNNKKKSDFSMVQVHAYINGLDSIVMVPSATLPNPLRESPSLEKLGTFGKDLNLVNKSSDGLILGWKGLNWTVNSRHMSMLMYSDNAVTLLIASRLIPTIEDEIINKFNKRWQPAIPIDIVYPLDSAQYGVSKSCYVPLEVINKNEKPSYCFTTSTPYSIIYGFNDTIKILYLNETELLQITSKIGYSDEKITQEIRYEPNLYEVWFYND